MGDDEFIKKQDHLKPQDAATVDPAKLTALTPEVVRLKWFLFFFVSVGFAFVPCFVGYSVAMHIHLKSINQ